LINATRTVYNNGMIVKAVRVKLCTNDATVATLADTMAKFNAACNVLSQKAWDTQTFRAYDLHKLAYHQTRADFALPSQLSVRAIAKVADSYKTDGSQLHTFGPRGAVVFDARCFKMKGVSSAFLTLAQGRHCFSLAHGGKQREQLSRGVTGEADLLFVDGNYYLSIAVKFPSIAVKFPDPPKANTSGGVLGVDLGIVKLATDSQGQSYSGAVVKAVRCRVREHRRQVQKKKSRSAFKRLQKINRRASRFAKDVNHCISKSLVQKAPVLQKALSLEDLSGIRERSNSLNKTMRWLMGNWAFADLAAKIVYKAAEVGLPVVFVDPRNTSRTCSECGYCEKANRKSQASFACLRCGFCANADFNASCNIARLGMEARAKCQMA
jgi:putative transposase